MKTKHINWIISAAIADADFFPNGGSNQPGCTSGGCSHTRAVGLYSKYSKSFDLYIFY